MRLLIAPFVALLFSFPLAADTVIYQCISPDALVSYQDQPCPPETMDGSSSFHQAWRSMRTLIKDGMKVNARLGPDVYSIMSCLEASEAYQQKLNDILSTLPAQTRLLAAAAEDLKVCGECRLSAANYCQKATDKLLKEASIVSRR